MSRAGFRMQMNSPGCFLSFHLAMCVGPNLRLHVVARWRTPFQYLYPLYFWSCEEWEKRALNMALLPKILTFNSLCLFGVIGSHDHPEAISMSTWMLRPHWLRPGIHAWSWVSKGEGPYKIGTPLIPLPNLNSSPAVNLTPRGHWVMLGGIFGCHNGVCVCFWV
jgi:hypothetical protein